MRKKMIWGLATLIVLLVGASIFLLTQTTDTDEPKRVYRSDVEPTLNKPPDGPGYTWVLHGDHWDKVPIPEADKGKQHQPPIAEVAKEKSTPGVPNQKGSTGRVGSDYPLLIETENPVILKPIPLRTVDGTGIDIDWESLSPAELAEKIKQAERRELLPQEKYDEGYHYRRSSGALMLDERGFPMLHKRYEPFISVFWTIRFKPSPEQLVEYRELVRRRDGLKIETPSSPEIDVIQTELDEMRRVNVGPLPISFGNSIGAPPEIFKAKEARAAELIRDLRVEIFRQLDLEYLLGFYIK